MQKLLYPARNKQSEFPPSEISSPWGGKLPFLFPSSFYPKLIDTEDTSLCLLCPVILQLQLVRNPRAKL